MIYTFNNYHIDPDNFSIQHNNDTVAVEPRVFDLIIYLIENKSQVVSREELFDRVWKTNNVLDATLSNHIKIARAALGDDAQTQQVIKTIHGRGYQFIADIKLLPSNSNSDDKSKSNTTRKNFSYIAALITIAILIVIIVQTRFSKQSIDGTVQNKSIAVLAFLDMSPLKNHEYFSEGMSEEILNKLSPISGLRVISRTSSFYYKDKEATVKEIGEQLNVSHVLEGSVRKQGDDIRITVQLIETKTSNHLWSQTYDRKIKDVFQVQDEIARAVSKKLKLSLLPNYSEYKNINIEAYSEYLKAKFLSQTNTRENNIQSELTIRKSIALDPNFAPAWQFLASTVFTLHYDSGVKSVKTRTNIALFAINKALELNKNLATAYAILARVQSQNLQFEKSDQNIRKALSLDNNNSYILNIAALNAMYSGNIEQSLKYREKIKDINPKHYKNIYFIGLLNFIALNLDSAIENFKLFIHLKPENAITYHMLSSAYIMQGNRQLALDYANKEKDGFWKDYTLCMALYAAGKVDQANAILEKFIVKRYYSRANIARIYASRAKKEKSFEWLNDAISHQDSSLIAWLQYPEFRKMHNDKRWHEIVRKMNFPANHWLVQQLSQ